MGHQALRDRIPSFDIRPARNALKLVRGELNNLIHHTMLTLTQRTLHGRRAFDILRFCGSLLYPSYLLKAGLHAKPDDPSILIFKVAPSRKA